jgi:hypothetical protein
VLAVLLVIGACAYGVTVGARSLVNWISGKEDQVGAERLASSSSPTGRNGHITVRATSIVDTAHFTRVELTVTNSENQSATLPLSHDCVLTAGGTTLQADSFRSGWSEEVPPESTQHGYVIFPGHLPDRAVTAQLSFSHIFIYRPFQSTNNSLVIRKIRVRHS